MTKYEEDMLLTGRPKHFEQILSEKKQELLDAQQEENIKQICRMCVTLVENGFAKLVDKCINELSINELECIKSGKIVFIDMPIQECERMGLVKAIPDDRSYDDHNMGYQSYIGKQSIDRLLYPYGVHAHDRNIFPNTYRLFIGKI